MGYEKNRRIEEDDQGWYYSDKDICSRCLSDSYLKEVVRSTAKGFECSFCDRTSKSTPIAVPFNEIMEIIGETVFQYFDHAENELSWDHEEGYFGSTYDSEDIVREELGEPSDNEAVIEEIIKSLGDYTWCEKHAYSLTGSDYLESSWNEFCRTVKHQTRYFFNAQEPPGESESYSDTIPVPQMLDTLRDIIEAASLVTTLPEDSRFFRIRVHKSEESWTTWDTLGPPPSEYAVTNRMSPAGISMFYAGLDMATARAETSANLPDDDPRVLTGAVWTNARPLTVLDLTRLPALPSIFEVSKYDRDHLVFLRNFVDAISQPVTHDGKEHIEYVPTQILTEYFRHRYRIENNQRLHGIIYPSAQRKKGRSVVIFASSADLDPDLSQLREERRPVLTLETGSIRRVPRKKKT